MRTIEVTDAQTRFGELIDSVSAGEEIVITRGQRPIARLSPASGKPSLRNVTPSSVGEVLKTPTKHEDTLGEMLER